MAVAESTMPKRRYANFHRARKYYRKAKNAERTGRVGDALRYRGLYELYDYYAYCFDGVSIGFSEELNRSYLIIVTHFDPVASIAHLPAAIRYKKMDPIRVELFVHGSMTAINAAQDTPA